jgi:large subunit ribosomal protein L9
VGVNDIHRVLRERGHQIEKKRIDLRGTIKEIGTYEVPVQVHPQVEALVTIDVLDEEGQVIAGQIAAPEPPPPLLGQEPEAEPAEAEAEAEGEVETLEDAAAAQDAAEEPKIDSVEALVEQALEAADQYETEHADEDEDADEASTADADEATGA